MPRPPYAQNLASGGRRHSQPVAQPFQSQTLAKKPASSTPPARTDAVPHKAPVADATVGFNSAWALEKQRQQEMLKTIHILPPTPLERSDPDLVVVHIYDIAEFKYLNVFTAFGSIPVGGAFHAGVEVYGREWSYSGGGILAEQPLTQDRFEHRRSIPLARTSCSNDRVCILVDGLHDLWLGEDYHWLHRNCLEFANEFCERLGVGRIPVWVDRFARGASAIEPTLQAFVTRMRSMSLPDPVHEAAVWAGFAPPQQVVAEEELPVCTDRTGRLWSERRRSSSSVRKPTMGSNDDDVELFAKELCPCCASGSPEISDSPRDFACVDDSGTVIEVQVVETNASADSLELAGCAPSLEPLVTARVLETSSGSPAQTPMSNTATCLHELGSKAAPKRFMVCAGYVVDPIYGPRMNCSGIAQNALPCSAVSTSSILIPSSSPPTPPPASPTPSMLFTSPKCKASSIADFDCNVAWEKPVGLVPSSLESKLNGLVGLPDALETPWPQHDQVVKNQSL